MKLFDTVLGAMKGRRTRIADRESLKAFLSRQAAFVTQKCVTEFCRVRAGVYWEKLFREEQFQNALLASNWAALTPVIAMLSEMLEGALRAEAGGDVEKLRSQIALLASEVRDEAGFPAHLDRTVWDSQSGLVEERLAHAALAAPRPVRHLPDPLARQVFDALPMHADLLKNDFDYIFNNLRMNLLRAHSDFIDEADIPVLVRNLID
jgi:hypothetical protein